MIGEVEIGEDSSIWPSTVIRGDVNHIRIGKRTNIQDSSVLHVTRKTEARPEGHPCIVGDDVTVGHKVLLHGCTLQNLCLVGMGAIILDGAVIPPMTLVGAGSLVPPGKQLESGFLWLGSPVRKVRPLNEKEMTYFEESAKHYVRLKNDYIEQENGI